MSSLIFNSNSLRLGNADYSELKNKPAIEGVELTSSTTLADLGLDKIFNYKGQVDTEADLKAKEADAKIGDTYNVKDTDENFTWNGTNWDNLDNQLVKQVKAELDHEIQDRKDADATLSEKIEKVDSDSKARDEAINEELENVVHWDHPSEGRKSISLANHDLIVGTDTEGVEHNLAMLSKWNVADFGAKGVHANLNTKDNVTINDSDIVLTDENLNNIIEAGDNIVINQENIIEPTTGLEYTKYNINSNDFDIFRSGTIKGNRATIYLKGNQIGKYVMAVYNEELETVEVDNGYYKEGRSYTFYYIRSKNPIDGAVITTQKEFPNGFGSIDFDFVKKEIEKDYIDLTDYASKSEVSSKIAEHNLSDQSHNDIRNLIKTVSDSLVVKANKATTLAGYGITDAYTKAEVDDAMTTITIREW